MKDLIDRQLLLFKLKGRRYSKASLNLINDMKRVEAIPVDWLKQYADNKGRYLVVLDIETLITEWEKENEEGI